MESIQKKIQRRWVNKMDKMPIVLIITYNFTIFPPLKSILK